MTVSQIRVTSILKPEAWVKERTNMNDAAIGAGRIWKKKLDLHVTRGFQANNTVATDSLSETE